EKISGGYKIYRYKSGLYIKDRWVHVPGAGAVRISVDNLGQAWIINDKGKVFTYKKRPSEDI
ncbi:hypothetical protein KAJ27_13775, partial [bacterium]|nr:hypothetical protein [bacterium]